MLNINVKKFHADAVVPTYAKPGDAGLDLTAVSKEYDQEGNLVYDIGLGFEIPEGYVGLLFPRSSNAKVDLALSNAVGVIDSGYRGTVKMKFKSAGRFKDSISNNGIKNTESSDFAEFPIPTTASYASGARPWEIAKEYNVGDRIGQLIVMPYPQVQLNVVEELSETERGTGGYGSTGS